MGGQLCSISLPKEPPGAQAELRVLLWVPGRGAALPSRRRSVAGPGHYGEGSEAELAAVPEPLCTHPADRAGRSGADESTHSGFKAIFMPRSESWPSSHAFGGRGSPELGGAWVFSPTSEVVSDKDGTYRPLRISGT